MDYDSNTVFGSVYPKRPGCLRGLTQLDVQVGEITKERPCVASDVLQVHALDV